MGESKNHSVPATDMLICKHLSFFVNEHFTYEMAVLFIKTTLFAELTSYFGMQTADLSRHPQVTQKGPLIAVKAAIIEASGGLSLTIKAFQALLFKIWI